jgi:hypothetical protein
MGPGLRRGDTEWGEGEEWAPVGPKHQLR